MAISVLFDPDQGFEWILQNARCFRDYELKKLKNDSVGPHVIILSSKFVIFLLEYNSYWKLASTDYIT